MLSLALSTIAFFVAGYYLKRSLDQQDIPKGATRSILIFSIALLVSYIVAAMVGYLFP